MDTCGLERVERFRINLNEENFASHKNTLTSSLPQRSGAVGAYGSGNDTLVNVSHVLLRKGHRIRVALAGADSSLFERPGRRNTKLTVYRKAQRASCLDYRRSKPIRGPLLSPSTCALGSRKKNASTPTDEFLGSSNWTSGRRARGSTRHGAAFFLIGITFRVARDSIRIIETPRYAP